MTKAKMLLILPAVVMCPALAMAHGEHQHIGGTFALINHLAAHVDYLAVALLAMAGFVVWIKTPGALIRTHCHATTEVVRQLNQGLRQA